eukprot:g1170.t1
MAARGRGAAFLLVALLAAVQVHAADHARGKSLAQEGRSFAQQRAMRNNYLKTIAPYHIVENNIDTMLQRVQDRVVGEMQKAENAHAKRMAALNLIYERRVAVAEDRVRKLEAKRLNLTRTDILLKGRRANLTRTFRARQSALDLASGEDEAMGSSSKKEEDMIATGLTARLTALADQKKKADAILAEELSVVRSVRKLILFLIKASEDKAAAEAKRLAALANRTRNRGVNMTEMLGEGLEMGKMAAAMLHEQQRIKNMTQAREHSQQKTVFSERVAELLAAAEEVTDRAAKTGLAFFNNTNDTDAKPPPPKVKTGANESKKDTEVTPTQVMSEIMHDMNNTLQAAAAKDPQEEAVVKDPDAAVNLVTGEPRGRAKEAVKDADKAADLAADVVLGKRHPDAGIVELSDDTDGLLLNKDASVNLINGIPKNKPKPKPAAAAAPAPAATPAAGGSAAGAGSAVAAQGARASSAAAANKL